MGRAPPASLVQALAVRGAAVAHDFNAHELGNTLWALATSQGLEVI